MQKKEEKKKRKPTVDAVRETIILTFTNAGVPKAHLSGNLKECVYEKIIKSYRQSKGFFLPVFINGKDCEVIEDAELLKIIKDQGKKISLSESSSEQYQDTTPFNVSKKTAESIFETMLITTDLFMKQKIKLFAFKSDPSYTFNRIPFDVVEFEQATPHWDRFLNNFTNTDAIKIFVGSLFNEDADRSQYLWLYGKGGNGKSTLAKIISSVLGDFVRFENPPVKGTSDEKYFSSGLIGKRLIVMDDCNKYGFVKDGLFKTLTGSDMVRVEKKFGHSHNAKINCKFLFTSNELPMISQDIADQRRIIFSSAKNDTSFDFNPEFEKTLIEELPKLISNCLLLYQANCPDHRPIPCDNTQALEIGGNFNEEIQAWVERNFDFVLDSHVKVCDFRALLAQTKLSDRRVYSYLEEKNVVRKNIKVGGVCIRCLVGLKQKVHFYNSGSY